MSKDSFLTVVQMNDSHAYLELHPELFWAGRQAEYRQVGGYARIATLLKQIRQEQSGQVLALDGGDTLHGTYTAVQTQGEALLPILNRLGFAAMTAHWEFAYGPAQFQQLAQKLAYPVLACNCFRQSDSRPFFQPYLVQEVGRLRVGVVGLAATIVDKTMPPSFSEGIYFTLGNEELPGHIAALRAVEKVDLIVVLSHLGFPQDLKLAEEVDGIDVLLSAHTHNRLYQPTFVNNTLIIQSGSHASFLGRLDLQIEAGRITDYRHQLVTVEAQIQPDPEVQQWVDEALKPYREELSRVVGHTVIALNRNTMLEATMDNLLLQSLLHQTGAQIAFSNGWRYGAPVPPGPITMNDLWNIIPVNPPVSTVELSGDEVWAMLEENLEHTFARDPYQQMGGYLKRCHGLNLYFKIENPHGQRIQELFIGDEPIRPNQLYSAAFVTQQGVPAKYGSKRQKLDVHAIEAMRGYLAQNRPVEAGLRGTVVAI
ncbi:MAG: 5'-nucleotidase C-terminal domain-containing protein [Anaerolineae bacterium]|nr:5'-nucleotidase C-terminal domain-containing protein [Anaerolineae bacterium]